MKCYLLCPETFFGLKDSISSEDMIYYNKEPPEYILNIFKEKNIKLLKSNTAIPNGIKEFPKNDFELQNEWPKKNKIESLHYWNKKIFVNSNNFNLILKKYNNSNYYYYCENLPEKNIRILKSISNKIFINKSELPNDIIIDMNIETPVSKSGFFIYGENNKIKRILNAKYLYDYDNFEENSVILILKFPSSDFLDKIKLESPFIIYYYSKSESFEHIKDFHYLLENSNLVLCKSDILLNHALTFGRNSENTILLENYDDISILKTMLKNK